jgi:hypothetical protein
MLSTLGGPRGFAIVRPALFEAESALKELLVIHMAQVLIALGMLSIALFHGCGDFLNFAQR